MSAKKTIVKISMQSNREEQMKPYLKKKYRISCVRMIPKRNNFQGLNSKKYIYSLKDK